MTITSFHWSLTLHPISLKMPKSLKNTYIVCMGTSFIIRVRKNWLSILPLILGNCILTIISRLMYSVLVHSGDFNAGHYYAFLKPDKDGKWYKFDDDRVTPATLKEVLDENYGGDLSNMNGAGVFKNPYARQMSLKRSMSAYMLVYLRKSRLDEILPEIDFPPPTHLSKFSSCLSHEPLHPEIK